MFLTVHASSGLIIGSLIKNPVLAFFIAFLSHFILDSIPHGDTIFKQGRSEKQLVKICAIAGFIDAIIMLIYLILFFYFKDQTLNWSITAGIIGAIIPDFLNGVYLITKNKILKPFYDINQITHYLEEQKIRLWPKIKFWGGLMVQILFFLFFNYLLFYIIK